MVKKIASLTLVGLLIQAMVFVEFASAGTKAEKEARHAADMKTRVVRLGVSKEANILVTLRDKTTRSGFISEVGEDSFVMTDSKAATAMTIAYSNVAQIGRRRRSGGWKYGVLLAAVGLTIAIIAAR